MMTSTYTMAFRKGYAWFVAIDKKVVAQGVAETNKEAMKLAHLVADYYTV